VLLEVDISVDLQGRHPVLPAEVRAHQLDAVLFG